MRYLLLLMLVVSLPAAADEVKIFYGGDNNCTLSWPTPETRVGGAVLNPEDISHYRVYVDTDPGFSAPLIRDTAAARIECESSNQLPAGTYYAGVSTVDTNSSESEMSESVSFIFIDKPPPAPNPPTHLLIGGTVVGDI